MKNIKYFFMSYLYIQKNDIKFIQNKSELRDVLLDYFKENNNINDLSEFKNDFLSFLKARKYIKDKSKLKDKFLDYLKEKKIYI